VFEAVAMKVAILTGGKDRHYVGGLVRHLVARGIDVALVGGPEEMMAVGSRLGRVVLHDLVGDQNRDVSWFAKAMRVMKYYVRFLIFAVRTDARLFHILWFRKFPWVERILVPLYLKALGKKVVFTAHNVDDRARDGRAGGFIHAFSLRSLYRRTDHIFVHTDRMEAELRDAFGIARDRVTVVPLGINDVIPTAAATREVARGKLGLDADARVMLFFGNIAPYKGLEDLIRALNQLVREDDRFVLVIVGSVKDPSCQAYWQDIERLIADLGMAGHVRKDVRYVSDDEAGLYFRAADVSVLPYRRVYQSGVLGLSYAQGLPVIAADVGSMTEDVVDGETGFIFRSGDSFDLAEKVRVYFSSDLFKDLEAKRSMITAHGAKRFSWTANAERARIVYERLLR
jgi:D-inositol-3-phosphate glycosyltransferase